MRHYRAILTLSALALPLVAAGAQPRRQFEGRPGGRPLSATELLDARRELELTPRQVARLDSIERAQLAQRRQFGQQLQRQRDSLCANRRPCVLTAEERQKLRDQMEANRPRREAMWQNDSTSRAMAMSLLDSTQRGRVQGWRMRQALRPDRPGRVGPRQRGPQQGWQRFDRPREFRGQRGFGPGFARPGRGPRFNRDDAPMGPRFNRDDMPPGPPGFEGPRRGMGGQFGPGPRMRRPDAEPSPPDSLPIG